MNFGARKRLAFFIILSLFCSCWRGLATNTSFLDIVGYVRYDGGEKTHIFKKRNGKEAKFKEGEVVAAADPAYDQTFKRLFIGSTPDESGHSGEERLKGFLNSIFYPEAEGDDDAVQIVSLEPLPTELSNTDLNPSSQKVSKMDVACRCYCHKPSQGREEGRLQAFDIEMQTAIMQKFSVRLYEYGLFLSRDQSKVPTYAVGILAPKIPGKTDCSEHIDLARFNEKGEFKGMCSGSNVHAMIVDLHQKLVLMHENPEAEIVVWEKNLGTTGKQWLSVLGMRYYMSESGQQGRYRIPLCKGTNDLVKSGILTLGKCSQTELNAAIERQRVFDDVVDTAIQARESQIREEEREKVKSEVSALEASNRDLQESNRGLQEQIEELKKRLRLAEKERDKRNLKNLEWNGGVPDAIALLAGQDENELDRILEKEAGSEKS